MTPWLNVRASVAQGAEFTASAILAILAVAVLITYSVQNGLILLTLAFLVSPLGLPMIAVWMLGGLQKISGSIKAI